MRNLQNLRADNSRITRIKKVKFSGHCFIFQICNSVPLKKREGKPYQYQFIQRFFSEYTYVKHIPDSLQLSQKQTKLNTHTYQKRL